MKYLNIVFHVYHPYLQYSHGHISMFALIKFDTAFCLPFPRCMMIPFISTNFPSFKTQFTMTSLYLI